MIYKLKSHHYTREGILLEPGTLDGDESHPWHGPPTRDMTPIDDEAKEEFERTWEWDEKEQRFERIEERKD